MMSLPSISPLTAGMSFSALHAGLHEKAHEAQLHAVLLLEQVLVLVAQVHHRAHVDLVEGREHGGGVLRLLEPACDGRPQPRHLHALFARGIVCRGRRAHLHGSGRLGDGRGRGSGALDRRHHVALGHAAILAGAGNGRDVDAGFGGQLAHRRRERRHLRGLRPRFADAALLPRQERPSRSLWSGRPGGAGAVLLGRARAFPDLTEQRADRDRLAVLGRDVAEHAGGRRRHLDRYLVGLELDQRLVDGDRIAGLLEPLADGRLGHRFAERGHADLSHGPHPSSVVAHARMTDERTSAT